MAWAAGEGEGGRNKRGVTKNTRVTKEDEDSLDEIVAFDLYCQ
jgi:hypothetical protein